MVGMNAIMPEIIPQLSMIRAIHLRAPNRSSRRLDGTSKMKYAIKKMPAPKPNAVCDRPRSWFIRERGKAHIYPVQIGDEVADDEERYQSPGDLRDGSTFYSMHRVGPAGLRFAKYIRAPTGRCPPQFNIAALT